MTTDSRAQCTVGVWPACGGGFGSQRDPVRTSSGAPPLKPLARQTFVAATPQSEAPFGARAQTSLTCITRIFGSRAMAGALDDAMLAGERAKSPDAADYVIVGKP